MISKDILDRLNKKQGKLVLCPSCQNSLIIRKGIRRNKMRSVQVYQCKNCKKIFTEQLAPNLTYDLKHILNAITFYNLGYNQNEVCKIMRGRYKINIPQRTLSSWINRFREITTISRLRENSKKLYNPKDVIISKKFSHEQVYNYKIHKAKVDMLCNPRDLSGIGTVKLPRIKDYLFKVFTKDFPHHIFKGSFDSYREVCKNTQTSLREL